MRKRLALLCVGGGMAAGIGAALAGAPAAPATAIATSTAPAATFPAAYTDTAFFAKRADIPHGKVEKVEYESKALNATYVANVYLPPGYGKDDESRKYPVLYLMHGANGNEDSWMKDESADQTLDNLYADGKAVPMIVVMPSSIAKGNPAAASRNFQQMLQASARFGEVLTKDLVPFVEGKYAVAADADHRAIAGYSAGGSEALNTGLVNLDTFAWVVAFSPPGNSGKAVEAIKDADSARKKLRLVWLSCGEQDSVQTNGKALHEQLDAKKIENIWHTEPGMHEPKVWRHCFYLVMPMLFRA